MRPEGRVDLPGSGLHTRRVHPFPGRQINASFQSFDQRPARRGEMGPAREALANHKYLILCRKLRE
jgi:hypothetical protein